MGWLWSNMVSLSAFWEQVGHFGIIGFPVLVFCQQLLFWCNAYNELKIWWLSRTSFVILFGWQLIGLEPPFSLFKTLITRLARDWCEYSIAQEHSLCARNCHNLQENQLHLFLYRIIYLYIIRKNLDLEHLFIIQNFVCLWNFCQ